MQLLIHDENVSEALIAQRRANGLDRYDEVWDGVYVMSPLANNEHQDLVMAFSGTLMMVWDLKGLGRTQPGANVSDREDDWQKNYRIPDVLCFTKHCRAQNRDTHWLGGPEFAIEIASPGEQVTEKLDFYATVGTREVLVVDRSPWQLSLYRVQADGKTMGRVASSGTNEPEWIESEIVPVKFLLDPIASKICIAERSGDLLREVQINPR